MRSVSGVCVVLWTFLYLMTVVSSSHIVFTSSSSTVTPLVTQVLTLTCRLRDGATTTVIGKRHAVPEVNSQGQVKSEVITGGLDVHDVIPRGEGHDDVNSQDDPHTDVIPKVQGHDDVTSQEGQPSDVILEGQDHDDVIYRDGQPTDVSFVHSLIMTKDGVDVASVTEHTAATVVNKTPDITVTGHIPGTGADKAVLEVSWKYPGPDQSGNYQCTVLGTDQFGHFQTFKQSVEISDADVTMNDVIGFIHQLKLTNDLYKTDIASLKQSNDLQAATIANQSKCISELSQKNTDMEREMSILKQRQNTTVMFSAFLGNYATISSGDVVVFNQVITNIGQNYNATTGVFTCLVSGYYVFDVHIQGQTDKEARVEIRLNGARLAVAGAEDQLDYQSASAQVNVALKQGDTVDVISTKTSYLNGGSLRYCMFSGHLVNLM